MNENSTSRWLFNFSAARVGGGLKRLQETVKWFDSHGGASFIVPARVLGTVEQYTKKNRLFPVAPGPVQRLLRDGAYLPEILAQTGRPDLYFSYGIPLFHAVGHTNWFHLSNAMALTTEGIDIPLKMKLKMLLLKRRIAASLPHAQIATGESRFAMNLVREHASDHAKTRFDVLPNGYFESEIRNVRQTPRKSEKAYAVTVGTLPYKQLDTVFGVFETLRQKRPDLEKLVIVGNKSDLPAEVARNPRVEIIAHVAEGEFFPLIHNADYYISASQIENSSIAALEGLLLAKKTVLRDIPSHVEMLDGLETGEVLEERSQTRFFETTGSPDAFMDRFPTWEKVNRILVDIADRRA